jgi:hypothetical protein
VIQGVNDERKEQAGALEYFSSDLKETIFVLTFHRSGIFRQRPDTMQSGSEYIRRVKSEMYCEKISRPLYKQ